VRECCARPRDRRVTRLASRGECRGDVIRIGDPGVVSLVTRVTVGWRTGVFAADVATRASDAGVRTSQREGRGRVVERRRPPDSGAMTDRAVERKRRSLVVRRDDAVVVLQVTR
jgi:hypothetical protein